MNESVYPSMEVGVGPIEVDSLPESFGSLPLQLNATGNNIPLMESFAMHKHHADRAERHHSDNSHMLDPESEESDPVVFSTAMLSPAKAFHMTQFHSGLTPQAQRTMPLERTAVPVGIKSEPLDDLEPMPSGAAAVDPVLLDGNGVDDYFGGSETSGSHLYSNDNSPIEVSGRKRKAQRFSDLASMSSPSMGVAAAAAIQNCKSQVKLPPPQKPEEGMTEEEKKTFKRQQRLLRNRVSAQLSRERKKSYLQTLEAQMQELSNANKMLMHKVEQLGTENSVLRRKLDSLEASDNSSYASGDVPRAAHGGSPVFFAVTNASTDCTNTRAVKRHKSLPRGARAGVVLFAIVFSFGVFYHLSGAALTKAEHKRLIRLSHDMAISPGVFRGRVLQSIAAAEEQMQQEQQEQNNQQAPQPSKMAVVALMGDEKSDESSAADTTALQTSHMRSLTKQLQESVNSIGLLAHTELLPDAEQADTDGAKDAPAPVFINGDPSSHAVQQYDMRKEQVHKALHEALLEYRRLMERENNGSVPVEDQNMPSSIMFCPSAIHVQPQHVVGGKNHNDTTSHVDTARMLLWVPSSSLSAGWKQALPHSAEGSGFGEHGLTEMNVQVSGIRDMIE